MTTEQRTQPHSSLYISEVFGPTFQGEGQMAGRRAAFIRLAGCNLHCTWCDTKYSWNFDKHPSAYGVELDDEWEMQNKYGTAFVRDEQVTKMTTQEVATAVFNMDVDLVVITGGEPMLQQPALIPLILTLLRNRKWVQIETNGTVLPDMALGAIFLGAMREYGVGVMFSVSPKLAHAQAGTAKQVAVDYPNWVPFVPIWKFVAQSEADLDEIPTNIPRFHIYVMPEGVDEATLAVRAKELAPAVLARGFNMTTRLHVQLWGNERGR